AAPPLLQGCFRADGYHLEVAVSVAIAALDHRARVEAALRPWIRVDVVHARLGPMVDRHFAVADPGVAITVPRRTPGILDQPGLLGIVVADDHHAVEATREVTRRVYLAIDAGADGTEDVEIVEHLEHAPERANAVDPYFLLFEIGDVDAARNLLGAA